jgi:serine palmitoyltransferase
MEDLERILLEKEELDKKNNKKEKVKRRFIIVEGIYMKSGDICKLKELVEMRKK